MRFCYDHVAIARERENGHWGDALAALRHNARSWLPSVSRGVIPGLDSVPRLAVVKQSALDDGCGPVPIEGAGNDQKNGWLPWRKVVSGGSGK